MSQLTTKALSDQSSIHGLFEDRVVQQPTAVALLWSDENDPNGLAQISYDALNRRANQLAHYLRSQGVGEGKLVGVGLDRSWEATAALLAILKCGAAYLPLDPAYPAERLRFTLTDSQAVLLITKTDYANQLPTAVCPLLYLDAAWSELEAQPNANLNLPTQPDQAAYVIYTSGSTGRPKGVVGLHKGALNRFRWMWREFPFRENDSFAQTTSLSFVDHVWELFGPLLAGVPAAIIPTPLLKAPRQLVDALAQHKASHIVLVPSLLRAILDSYPDVGQRLAHLRLWTSSGEALPPDLARQFSQTLPQATLLNIYGSSEVSADAAWFNVASGDWQERIPIGQPIDQVELHLLDEQMQPVPAGETGELYVGGAGLAQGYLGQPELTAAQFIPHPFTAEPGARLYKTGDLARQRPDGLFEFMGRADQQVKLRGMRIELGEIETVLREHPAVSQVVVTMREDQPGSPYLAAYVVPAERGARARDDRALISRLRAHLSAKLPDYMRVDVYLFLPQLPLTPSGKIDRLALPAPEFLKERAAGDGRSPQTLVEKKLADLWRDLLNVPVVFLDDNFFELGGHSLNAPQLLYRVQTHFQLEISLGDFFERATLGALAAEIEKRQAAGERDARQPIPRRAVTRAPLSSGQRRFWFLDQLEPGNLAYHLSDVCHLPGPIDRALLQRSLDALAERHEILRTSIGVSGGDSWQQIAPPAPVALEWQIVADVPPAERRAVVNQITMAEMERPFDLTRGPLWRVKLLQFSDDDHYLILRQHHIMTDGWSFVIFMRELTAIYEALQAERPSPLPALPIQYADFAAWQQAEQARGAFAADLAYWEKQLAGYQPKINLPTDGDADAAPQAGDTHYFELDADLAAKLRQLGRQENGTLFMTLLAAFYLLLHRYSGQEDIGLGIPVAGRTRPETEGLIGFFINNLILRGDLSGNPTFRELLARVRQTALDGYAHQNLPFDRLVEALQPERTAEQQPLFQAMFTLQNLPPLPAAFAGLALESWEIAPPSAQFDLDVALEETGARLRGMAQYKTGRFSGATIRRMIAHWQTLLAGIVANPDARLSELPLLTAAEQAELCEVYGRSPMTAAPPPHPTLHQLVEKQARERPTAVALILTDPEQNFAVSQQLSYAELNERANQLAHYLQTQGVGRGDRVAIFLERSPDMYVSLLGVLKSGAAYMPLDPNYPRERLRLMLAEGQPQTVLTQTGLAGRLPQTTARVVALDDQRLTTSDQQLPTAVSPDDPAYIIFTSGSTGRPKGVVIPHRAAVNHNYNLSAYYDLAPGDRMLQFSSISFDVAVEEIFTCWVRGATVVGRPAELLIPTGGFHRLIERQAITVVNLPTAYWQEWATALHRQPTPLPASLRLVITGTEKASSELLAQWRAAVDRPIRWINAYGPTETTVTCTVYEPGTTDDGRRTTNDPSSIVHRPSSTSGVPIGRPIANVYSYILDAHLNLVPPGAPGELHIGGAGLALGYLGDERLTAVKFIPDPFSDDPNARLYKTGDLARYLPSGDIEYLGRVDAQVKIRGYRVELGEINHYLQHHPLVAESATLAEGGQMTAYVVPGKNAGAPELWPCPGDYQIFDEVMYYAMTHDQIRVDRYRAAIEKVAPGKVVVDLGTGKDMVLARQCVAAGARRVYAVEVQETAYQQALADLRAEGLDDKIKLLRGNATEVELPELVDVCVSELIGVIGNSEGTVPILNSARRLLKLDGVMIPARCLTQIAAVRLPTTLAENPAFTELSADYVRQIFAKVGHPLDLRVAIRHFPLENLLSDTAVFEALDFSDYIPLEYERTIQLTIQQDGVIDGLLLWLNLYPAEGELIDSLNHNVSWLPVYWPIFYPGVEVKVGDRITALVHGYPSPDGLNPDYAIKGRLERQDSPSVAFAYNSTLYGQNFRHNPFYDRLFANDEIQQATAVADNALAHLPNQLKSYLQRYLPDYMIPATIMILPELPRLASGKLNRAALPSPYKEQSVDGRYQPPRNETETKLTNLWEETLNVSQVGVTDNFFDLGGHSLQALQLASRMTAVLNRALMVKHLFLYPTIAQIVEGTADLPTPIETAATTPISGVAKQVNGAAPPPATTAHLQVERRSPLNLWAIGEIPPVDAVELYYPIRGYPLHEWFRAESQGAPLFTHLLETDWGRLGSVILPCYEDEIYQDQARLVQSCVAAMRIAARLNAQTIALTGLIASATDYGRAILPAITHETGLPALTTGHATTTAAVILNIKRSLELSGRTLNRERVGFLGLGSIGLTSLMLMLRVLPHPAELILCDLYSKRPSLEQLRRKLKAELGYQGIVTIAESIGQPPASFYNASLIVGATNMPAILDIDRVRPGTILVDDSSPHCFNSKQAIRRFQEQGDILMTEGGVLKAPVTMREIRYIPHWAPADAAQYPDLWDFRPNEITGCMLSGLLSVRYPDLPPTLGLTKPEESARHYRQLTALDFQGAPLHCEDYRLDEKIITLFRQKYGDPTPAIPLQKQI